MLTRDFYYELPEQLIAQEPLESRTASRMLVMGSESKLEDCHVSDLPDYLHEGDLLVLNDTKVIPARLFGHKITGGRAEVLVERIIDSNKAWAHVRASKSPSIGGLLTLEDDIQVEVINRKDDLFMLEFKNKPSVLEALEQYGRVPLPPYIDRETIEADSARYQTVFARHAGAVAAPTAGLHFDETLLEQIRRCGVEIAWVTLHIGAGTFQPVRVDNPDEHHMHTEYAVVNRKTCDAVHACHQRDRRVVAVGTTCVRSLESAAASGELKPFAGDTNLFIKPGYRFRVVDALVTNFHLPESTLLMLVCAFGGYQSVMTAYRHAITQSYRFFSYGDAMFLARSNEI